MKVLFEGVDGAGKSTQAQRLAKWLKAKYVKFPNAETEVGKLIYSHLANKWEAVGTSEVQQTERLNAIVFQALHVLNRMETVTKWNFMDRHMVVDRFWPAGWVYGRADGIEFESKALCESLIDFDLHILVDIPVGVSVERTTARGTQDRYEVDVVALGKRVSLYRELWADKQSSSAYEIRSKWLIIDGTLPIDDVERNIQGAITERLLNR